MQARSSEKVKQVMEMMKILHLKVEARQRVSKEMFIETTVVWTDDEKYPAAEPEGQTGEAEATAEVAPGVQEVSVPTPEADEAPAPAVEAAPESHADVADQG